MDCYNTYMAFGGGFERNIESGALKPQEIPGSERVSKSPRPSPDRFMTANEAAEWRLAQPSEGEEKTIFENSDFVAEERLGAEKTKLTAGVKDTEDKLRELRERMGLPNPTEEPPSIQRAKKELEGLG
jgi:hypothetical protein